jgi:hypothetical protein
MQRIESIRQRRCLIWGFGCFREVNWKSQKGAVVERLLWLTVITVHLKQVPWRVSPKRRKKFLVCSCLCLASSKYLALNLDEAAESSIVNSSSSRGCYSRRDGT